MTRTDDRLSLSVGNWVALAALAVVPLGAVVSGWADIKAEGAATRVEIRQLRDDVSDIRQTLRAKDRQ